MYYKLPATSLTTSALHDPPSPSDADIIPGRYPSGNLEPPDAAERDPTAAMPKSPSSGSHDRQTAFNSAGRRAKASSPSPVRACVIRVRPPPCRPDDRRARREDRGDLDDDGRGDGLLARPRQMRERGNESESGWPGRERERERETEGGERERD